MNQKKLINPNTSENEMLKQIMSGVYRNHYLIYNRKSTDEPENQKNSIKYQKSENTRFAFREHLSIASLSLPGFCVDGIISEKHSGFKEDTILTFDGGGMVQYRIERPKFYQLVQFLNKKYFKGIIVLCWDRVSRNKGDNTVIEKLMKQGVDFRFTLASYDKTSSGALHKDIDGMFAEHHSRVTSEKVSLTMRNNREQGVCTYKAPVGYLNQGIMEHKPIDPVRAPVIIKMFEMYATGEWSLIDLARWSIEQGFTMPASRRRKTVAEKLFEEEDDVLCEIEAICRPPSFTTIQKILTNTFYTGKIRGNGGMLVPSISHEPIISQHLFDTVQKALQKKKISAHYIQQLDHPFRGVVRCADCKRVYTPYLKKGIMYFGCRCSESCSNTKRSINLSFISDTVGAHIQSLWLTQDELMDVNRLEDSDALAIKEQTRQTKVDANERKSKKLKEDLAYLKANKLTLLKAGVYAPQSIVEEEENINQELNKIEEAKSSPEASLHETVEEVIELSERLKNLYFYYEKANSHNKEKIIKIIFSELTVFENELKYKGKNGFQALENRFVPLGDQKTWLSELVSSGNLIHQSLVDIKEIIFQINNESTFRPP